MEERKVIYKSTSSHLVQYNFRILQVKNDDGKNEEIKVWTDHLPSDLIPGQELAVFGHWKTYRNNPQFVSNSMLSKAEVIRLTSRKILELGSAIYHKKSNSKVSTTRSTTRSITLSKKDMNLLEKFFISKFSMLQMNQICFLHFLTQDISTNGTWNPYFEPLKKMAQGMEDNLHFLLSDPIRYFLRHMIPNLEFVKEDNILPMKNEEEEEEEDVEDALPKMEDVDFYDPKSKRCKDYIAGVIWKGGQNATSFLQRAHQYDSVLGESVEGSHNKIRLGLSHSNVLELQKILYALSVILLYGNEEDPLDKGNEFYFIHAFKQHLRQRMTLFPHFCPEHIQEEIESLQFIDTVPKECLIMQRIVIHNNMIGRVDVHEASLECISMLNQVSNASPTLENFDINLFENCQPNNTQHAPTSTQKSIAQNILQHNVNILQGLPGTGKTTFVLTWVQRYVQAYSKRHDCHVAQHILAPTNAAVTLLSQNTGISRRGRTTPVRTVASCCWTVFNEPSNICFLVIDESSMVGTLTWAKLFKKLRKMYKSFHIVMIGDKYQLEPIETGYLFADLINLSQNFTLGPSFASHSLTQVMRQTNKKSFMKPFLESCRDIADDIRNLGSTQKLLKFSDRMFHARDISGDEVDLSVFSCHTMQAIVDSYKPLYTSPNGLENCLIISPFRNSKFPISTNKLNEVIQNQFNANNLKKALDEDLQNSTKHTFRPTMAVGDPIVIHENIKELRKRSSARTKLVHVPPFLSFDLFNNMRGVVVRRHIRTEFFYKAEDDMIETVKILTQKQFYCAKESCAVGPPEKKLGAYYTDAEEGSDVVWLEVKFWDMPDEPVFFHINYEYIDLAYAVTVHVAQGQTCDKVLCVVRDAAHKMIKNELITTAVSRAKTKTILCIHAKSPLNVNDMKNVLQNAVESICKRNTWFKFTTKDQAHKHCEKARLL